MLLIDEIDRADDDFEAFLLELLAEATVTIPEIGTITATHPPIIVLTSNRTRDLHDAVKRRCLYHWIDYPTPQREVEIVRRRVKGSSEVLAVQVANAVSRMRESDVQKPPGIAEAIDWLRALEPARGRAARRRRGRAHARVGAQVRRGPGRRSAPPASRASSAPVTDEHAAETFGVETIHLDLPPLVGAFTRRLHDAGLPMTPARAADLARALALVRPVSRRAPVLDGARRARDRPVPGGGVRRGLRRGVRRPRSATRPFEPDEVQTVAAPADDRPAAEHETAAGDGAQRDARDRISTAPRGADDADGAEVDVPLAMASDEERLRRGASTASSRTSWRSCTG